jgi:hypothetical protein
MLVRSSSKTAFAIFLTLAPGIAFAVSEVTQVMLEELQMLAPVSFSAAAGKATWFKDIDGRSCTTCHTESVLVSGRHERTGKVIEAMAPSINPQRLTDRKKINKWFLRNCKWTLGRECTAQEKGDILVWLSEQ